MLDNDRAEIRKRKWATTGIQVPDLNQIQTSQVEKAVVRVSVLTTP